MSRITLEIRDPQGTLHKLSVEPEKTLMEAIVAADLEGVDAECGGECSCATCHVVIDSEWAEKLALPTELETDMLDFVEDERQETSRLSCQIQLAPELDGLKATIPGR